MRYTYSVLTCDSPSVFHPPDNGFATRDLLALLDGDFHIVADIDFCTRPEFDHAVELAVLQFIAQGDPGDDAPRQDAGCGRKDKK